MEREACDSRPESLQQDMVSRVSGDACDFIDKGQEAAWEPTTPCLQKQPRSPAVQDMTAAFTLQWKAEISNHTSDRPRELGNLSASCRIFGGLVFLKIKILFSYSDVIFPFDAKASKPNFSAYQGMWCAQQSPIAHSHFKVAQSPSIGFQINTASIIPGTIVTSMRLWFLFCSVRNM